MRFAELDLERYGRFQDCKLTFPAGSPDLHFIFGANEAGKSTTVAAVSDMLFGFQTRSPYNFRFDYGLLRIGAVLEEGETRLVCRRRKAQIQSLVDAGDHPLDEAPLLAMLRGQQREAFRVAFSLNQARLREGGHAMADPKSDLGQALFAAGSGMTEVAAVLATLRQETDDIWAPRAAARRTYTIAERKLTDALHRVRDDQVRPKAWTDTRRHLEQAGESLLELERARGEKAMARRRLERWRRIGPDVRHRIDLTAAANADLGTIVFSEQTELSARAALAAFEQADLALRAAQLHLDEIELELSQRPQDDAILALEREILALVERRGAEQKAALDLIRLKAELAEAQGRASQLSTEVGGVVSVGRSSIAHLRAIALRESELRANLLQYDSARDDADGRAAPLRGWIADAALDETLPALRVALQAAQALGSDIDARCAAQGVGVEQRRQSLEAAMARLTPWSGDLTALRRTPAVSPDEIDEEQAKRVVLREARVLADTQIAGIDEERTRLELERRQLADSGSAVSSETLAQARETRTARWRILRPVLLGGSPLQDGESEVGAYEAEIQHADTVADSRFASAAASGQLLSLDGTLEALSLRLTQAEQRRTRIAQKESEHAAAWNNRLQDAGLPPLEPLRLRAWFQARNDALVAATEVDAARAAWEGELERRREAKQQLLRVQDDPGGSDEGTLSPLVIALEGRRAAGEALVRDVAERQAALRTAEDQLASVVRERARAESERALNLQAWESALKTAGLAISMDGAEHRLSLLEERRALLDSIALLDGRVEGIARDAAGFAGDVNALCDRLGMPSTTEEPSLRLESVRERLSAARTTADARAAFVQTRDRVAENVRMARAERTAADQTLAPRQAEFGLADVTGLSERLDEVRARRQRSEALRQVDERIRSAGDGLSLDELLEGFAAIDPDRLAIEIDELDRGLAELDAKVTDAANAAGAARQAFEGLQSETGAAAAAEDAAEARAELDLQTELYLLKKTQEITLRWALDRYREQRQNPLLTRASALFKTLTLGRYLELRVDHESSVPRLVGLCNDGATLVEVENMSEGTSDQLFLALRLAAVEQTVTSGVRLPFIADDLFVNFDDERAAAGLRVLKELAKSTQVLVFTHHTHLLPIAETVAGSGNLSVCRLG